MATSTPQLSIILPTHNRADVLPYAIQSVLAQEFTDWEMLIVGDGCTDETAAVVAPFLAADARLRWLDYPKAAGFGYANRNLALAQTRGALIGFMAHDDLISPDHFSLLVKALADPAAHLAQGGTAWVGTGGGLVPTVFPLQDPVLLGEFLAGRQNRLPATAFVYRQEARVAVGDWDAEMPRRGDLDLWSRILRAYGADSLRVVEMVSTFHFRAIWRTPDVLAPDNEPLWKYLHAQPDRLPAALQIPMGADTLEQAACWRWWQEGPHVLPAIREALHVGQAIFTWELEARTGAAQADFLTRAGEPWGPADIAHHRARASRLREELDRTKAQLAKAKAALGSKQ